MNTTTVYTPLESLLLFQSLAAHGTKPDAFSQISDLLQNNPLVRDGETYDPGRLKPEALRELYIQLLGEDFKNEAVADSHEDAPSRKRKLQSPPLPSIKDANENNEKLPQLVDRLYARYRDYMIRLIREDERQYDILQREIAEIERGEWDERILKENQIRANKNAAVTPDAPRSRKTSTESPLPAHVGLNDNLDSTVFQKDASRSPAEQSQRYESSPQTESKSDGLAIDDVPKNLEANPSSPLTEPSPSVRNSLQASPLADNGPVSTERSRDPSPQPVQIGLLEDSKRLLYKEGSPGSQSPLPSGHTFIPFSPQQHAPYRSPMPTSRPFSVPSVPYGNTSTSPQGLSPPQGHSISQGHTPPSLNSNNMHHIAFQSPNIQRVPGSPPVGALDQLADVAGQQHRAPSVPRLFQQPGGPLGHPYPPLLPQYNPIDGRSCSASPQGDQQLMQQQPPPKFNSPPVQSGQRPLLRPDTTQSEQRQYNSPYNPSQGPCQSVVEQFRSDPAQTPRPLPPRDISTLPHSPLSLGPPRHSTGKATRWTATPTVSTPKIPKSPVPPAFEPLSPVPSLAKLPPPFEPAVNSGAPKAKRRGRPPRVARADSTPSSFITGSYRSQSVLSHADELSLDNDIPIMQKVKQESSTPRPTDDTRDTTGDDNTPRLRPSTLKDVPSVLRVPKRKRLDVGGRNLTNPPTHVLWTRNFPKISASALERIGAHRYASTFALPIKERDAPGYKDIILRPQDLKSIRAALVSGNKCGAAIVTAAAAATGDQGQASMLLPISEDLIPPKSIINNAQLEKELMRMFANAIMFNPDPNRGLGRSFEVKRSIEESGGPDNYRLDENRVVKMTRDMFSDAERIVREMRSAEQRSEGFHVEAEEDEVDELAGDGDQGGSTAKRRRRA